MSLSFKPLDVKSLVTALFWVIVFFGGDTASAKTPGGLRVRRGLFFYGGGDYVYADTAADQLGGANYTERFNRPTVLAAGWILFLSQRLILGFRYEHWIARRRFDFGGVERTDTLQYQTVGAELGLFLMPNPRVYFIITGGASYPTQLRVTSNGAIGLYETSEKPITLQGRVMSGLRFNSFLSFYFEGGYRRAILGNLKGNSQPFLSGDDLNYSSPFLGAGFGFQF